jgi:protein-disulfide isomerase
MPAPNRSAARPRISTIRIERGVALSSHFKELLLILVRARILWLAFACVLFTAAPYGAIEAADMTQSQRQTIDSIIHDYLMQHPDVLIAALRAAQDKLDRDNDAKTTQAVARHRHDIFDDPSTPVGGNPRGDVTIVEFFDYRCPYCKQVQPSLQSLLQQDPKLRLVYKEFPILGPASVTAAHAALAAQRQGKYDAFHTAMMASRGQITENAVFAVAASVGLDVDRLKRDMAAPEIAQALKDNLALADALDIHGTPAFIINDHVVPGALDLDALKTMVADARKR